MFVKKKRKNLTTATDKKDNLAARILQMRIYGVPLLSLAGVFIILLVLCALFPYSADDWFWGGSASDKYLAKWFADYNGRYLSNLLCMALTRVPFLHVLFVAASFLGIALCIQVFVGKKDSRTFWVALIFMLLMPVAVRAQGLVWTSGFVNYTFSALLILIYLCIVRGCLGAGTPYKGVSKKFIPLCAILGFAASLLVETVTVANVVASIILLIYTKRKCGFWDGAQIAFVVGAVLGAALMFSNGAYYLIVQGQDLPGSDGSPYREIAPDGFLQSAFFCFSTSIVPYLVLHTWPMQLIFAACAFYSWKTAHAYARARVDICADSAKGGANEGGKNPDGINVSAKNSPDELGNINASAKSSNSKNLRAAKTGLLLPIAIALLIVGIYGVCYCKIAQTELSLLLKSCNAIIGLLWIITLLVWSIFYWKNGRHQMLFAFLYALALVLPLLVVSQYGARCYLPTYFMMCLFASLIVQQIFARNNCNNEGEKKASDLISLLAPIFAIVLLIVWLIIYMPIGFASFERDAKTEQAKISQAKELVIPTLNAGSNVWRADPSFDMLKNWYRKFYGLDKDVEITIQE